VLGQHRGTKYTKSCLAGAKELSPALQSLCENKSFGSRVERIERKSSPQGGIMIAQHVAEGGVLGEVESRSESPGDETGSHTDSEALGSLTI
jgi:hypothetical protein